MDKKVFIFICAGLVIFSLALWGWGCSKKTQTSELSETPAGTTSVSAPTDVIVINPTDTPATPPAPSTSTQVPAAALSTPETSVAPAMSEGEKRSAHNKDIQTALKNAGFYTGEVDGRIGPMTRKAIKDFQTSKGLTADGKVGSKTWAELEKYLTASSGTKSKKKK